MRTYCPECKVVNAPHLKTCSLYPDIAKERDAEIVTLQAELAKHRWIPVEEQFPEQTKDDLRPQVLVFDGESVTGALWRHYDYGWDFETDSGKPTHWKPIILPEGE